MLEDVLKDEKFVEMMEIHGRELLDVMLVSGVHFSILTNIAQVSFNPALPIEIESSFKPLTLFYLAGYTFESAKTDEQNLYFEAGFGPQNIGSFVTVPLNAILQIIIEETPIFINLSIPTHKKGPASKSGVEKSMQVFMANPHNKKLLKK